METLRTDWGAPTGGATRQQARRLPSIAEASSSGRRERTEKPWGYELLWAISEQYAGKILHVLEGGRLSLQYHERKHETLFLLAGEALVQLGDDVDSLRTYRAGPGDCFVVAPGRLHRIVAISTCDFFEVSTPELDDVVRIQDDYGRS